MLGWKLPSRFYRHLRNVMKQIQPHVVLLCALLLCAPWTYAQDSTKQESPRLETERPHWYSGLIDPYQPRTVPPVSVSNSPRIDALLRAGNLYLSLNDA